MLFTQQSHMRHCNLATHRMVHTRNCLEPLCHHNLYYSLSSCSVPSIGQSKSKIHYLLIACVSLVFAPCDFLPLSFRFVLLEKTLNSLRSDERILNEANESRRKTRDSDGRKMTFERISFQQRATRTSFGFRPPARLASCISRS